MKVLKGLAAMLLETFAFSDWGSAATRMSAECWASSRLIH